MRKNLTVRAVLPSLLALTMAFAGTLLWSTQQPVASQSNPFEPTGVVANPPAAQLPRNCTGFFAGFTCRSDSDFEYALEQQYWGHLGNGEYDQMADWISGTKWYLLIVRDIEPVNRGRLETFIAFGHVGLFVQGANDDPLNLTNVLEALVWVEKAKVNDPNSPNLQSLEHYLKAYVSFALGSGDAGHDSIADLYAIADTYGPVAGSEGQLVGAMAQLLLQDPAHVQTGLTSLNDCNTIACRRNSVIAPYKEVGMQIAIAEGYARLGNLEAMEAAYDLARDYATANDYPTPWVIEESRDQLVEPGGIMDQWESDSGNLGEILLPLPPSAGALACQSCHVTGQNTSNYFDDIADPGPVMPGPAVPDAGLACTVTQSGSAVTVSWSGQGDSDYVIIRHRHEGRTTRRGKVPSSDTSFQEQVDTNGTYVYSVRTQTGSTRSDPVNCS